jgi:hypothetical protein
VGRPPEHGPIVAVDVDGEVLMWCQGQITGPRDLRLAALAAGHTGERVPLGHDGPLVTADLGRDEDALETGAEPRRPDFVAIAAALTAASPGRARLIEAPVEVWAALDLPPLPPTVTIPVDPATADDLFLAEHPEVY